MLINKIPRSSKAYGGGIGDAIFDSDTFRVVHWRTDGEKITTIASKLCKDIVIVLDGWHNIDWDEECVAQLTPSEILSTIEAAKRNGVKQGRREMAAEIKRVNLIIPTT